MNEIALTIIIIVLVLVLFMHYESKYSDLPYYILKEYFEKYSGKKYDKIVKERVFNPLGLDRIGYLPLKTFSKGEIVPTESDSYFRFNSF